MTRQQRVPKVGCTSNLRRGSINGLAAIPLLAALFLSACTEGVVYDEGGILW